MREITLFTSSPARKVLAVTTVSALLWLRSYERDFNSDWWEVVSYTFMAWGVLLLLDEIFGGPIQLLRRIWIATKAFLCKNKKIIVVSVLCTSLIAAGSMKIMYDKKVETAAKHDAAVRVVDEIELLVSKGCQKRLEEAYSYIKSKKLTQIQMYTMQLMFDNVSCKLGGNKKGLYNDYSSAVIYLNIVEKLQNGSINKLQAEDIIRLKTDFPPSIEVIDAKIKTNTN